MDLHFPINFAGHVEWLKSGYELNLAKGDVITRDGEVLGTWRVVEYDPDAINSGGRYEFLLDGHSEPHFAENFALLDSGVIRGMALSDITRTIKEWHETRSSQ